MAPHGDKQVNALDIPDSARPRVVVLSQLAAERAVVSHWALASSYNPVTCDTLPHLQAALGTGGIELIVIFSMASAGAPLGLLRKLRSSYPTIPIVCLAKPESARAVLCHGATDFFVSSFDIDEFLARLEARAGEHRPAICDDAPDTIGRRSGQVRLDGKEIAIRPAARRILAYLCDHAGRAVSVQELQAEVLHTKGKSHTVHNHIYEIRRALKAAAIHDLICTHKGTGCFSISAPWAARLRSVPTRDDR